MTRITDWCVAAASALITTIGSFSAAGGAAQLVGELLDAAERHRVVVDDVLALRVDQDRDLVRPLELALGLRASAG